MRFTEEFGITPDADDDWFDVEVTEDTPLYVDPFLVFEDDDEFWSDTHDEVVKFFGIALDYVRKANGNHNSAHWGKAERMLMFPEPSEFVFGLSMGHPLGSGTGRDFAFRMADALDILRRHSIDTVKYVEAFALFCDGMGVDRISDLFCNVVKQRFIKYTLKIVDRHAIDVTSVRVKHADWSRATGRWVDANVMLPKNPATNRGVILCPTRFLKDIPIVTPDGFWSWAEVNEGRVLRDDLNYDLAESLSKSEKIAEGRHVARREPEMAFRYLDEKAEEDHEPYDVDNDPKLLVGWAEAGRNAAEATGRNLEQPAGEDGFLTWVRGLMVEFKDAVEQTDLWKVLWSDDLTKHRPEKIVQAVASCMWVSQCRAVDVDISREVNIGRGPVDFKFSAGWTKRALAEIKLIKSTQFFSGASKQLPQYLKSEKIEGGFYLCVGFMDQDFEEERLKRVRDTCKALSEAKDVEIEPIFVDARNYNKPSASKIRS
ncbi:hypothetical protein [Amycolatopsis sp. WAC 01416]|uniref:hypothetical protein n=1 Tax=Amycolatopsis sp. WAC 01416 TaxID=2203196 RepID=UPI000F79CF7F|nr:hypothetical protein [Amycolatopsis sp. WAC 01416]